VLQPEDALSGPALLVCEFTHQAHQRFLTRANGFDGAHRDDLAIGVEENGYVRQAGRGSPLTLPRSVLAPQEAGVNTLQDRGR
jgi:hypothetical protein